MVVAYPLTIIQNMSKGIKICVSNDVLEELLLKYEFTKISSPNLVNLPDKWCTPRMLIGKDLQTMINGL